LAGDVILDDPSFLAVAFPVDADSVGDDNERADRIEVAVLALK
jgi:hypothetical protein